MLRRPTLERHAVHAEENVTGAILPRSFYQRSTVAVARGLLGKVLATGFGSDEVTAGIIVETEAYPGGDDLASHSAAGITKRTWVIFGPPGHAYVYFSYGMHVCMNIVAEPDGRSGCVLIRALEPIAGLDLMRERRETGARPGRDLTSGPGKLTRALGITLADYGADLTCGHFVVCEPTELKRFRIDVTPRIGITKCADLPLRFLIRDNRFVSR